MRIGMDRRRRQKRKRSTLATTGKTFPPEIKVYDQWKTGDKSEPAAHACNPPWRAPAERPQPFSVGFQGESGLLQAVDQISFDVPRGRTIGLVGESGCGKSVTALSLLRLLPQPAGRILDGQVLFEGRDLVKLPLAEMHKIRGARIGMIFQEPMAALNPVQTIGRQIGEVFRLHLEISPTEALRRAIEMLGKVGIPSPEIPRPGIPASTFGRHAPARRHRHGAGLRPAIADRRQSRRPRST